MCQCNNERTLNGIYHDEYDMLAGLEELKTNDFVEAAVLVGSGGLGYIAVNQLENMLVLDKDGKPKTKGLLATAKNEDNRNLLYMGSGLFIASLGLVSEKKYSNALMGFGSGWAGFGLHRFVGKRFPKLLSTNSTPKTTVTGLGIPSYTETNSYLAPSMDEIFQDIDYEKSPSAVERIEKEEPSTYQNSTEIYY